MNTIELIKMRHSIRKFIDKPISKEILTDLVDCGRLAPTANNNQPWQFLIVTDKKALEFISEKATYGKFIKTAQACIIVFCDKANSHCLEDGAAATENIIIAAKSYGIGTCWVAGYNRTYEKDISDYLKVPEGLRMISIVPLGYPVCESQKTSKKPLLDVLHWERF